MTEPAQMEIRAGFGMRGFFPLLEAFQGIDVVTVDPLRPELTEEGPANVLIFPGTRRILAEAEGPDEQPNKLLTNGLNQLATQSGWLSCCQAGSGTSQPVAGDTALESYVAGTSTIVQDDTGAQSERPYYLWRRRTFRFAQGAAAGNLNEVGIGWSTSGAALICRHRTVNSLFEETTIPILANEYFQVTYELRYYPQLFDTVGTITLDGTVYDTVTRPSQVTLASLATQIGNLMGQYSAATSDWRAYDGEIGDITQAPSGNAANCDNANQSNSAYVNNSFEIEMVCNTGPNGWNLGAGIRSIRIKTTAGDFQSRFGAQSGDGTIPKTSAYVMQLKWTLSWAELLGLFALPGSYAVTGYSATLTHNT